MNIQLQNQRIKLRAPEPEDLDVFYKWENDTSLWKFGTTLVPVSRFILREYLSHAGEDIYTARQLRLVIEEKETAIAVGTIDLFDYDPYHHRCGVGLMIDTAFQKKGYGKEALYLLIGYCFEGLQLYQMYAHIPVSNNPCYRLFSSCGFTLSGTLRGWLKREEQCEDVHLLQLLKQDVKMKR